MLHITERVENSLVIIIGQELQPIVTNYLNIEHKFIYVEVTETFWILHQFCPNCTTINESWPKAKYAWKRGYGITPPGRNNLFSSCCDPLKGKKLKVACSVGHPAVHL